MIRRAALTAAFLAIALHAAESASVLFLPGDAPLFNDFSLLQYTASAAREFHSASGALWGYDPHFMAGYPLTFIWNSNALIQLLAVALGGTAIPALLRGFLFFCLVAAPLMFFLALRNFGFTPRRALAGTAIYLLYFRLGALALFHFTGMATAGLSATYNIWAVSLVCAYLRHRRARTLLALLAVIPLAPLVHKTAVVVLAPPLIVLLAQNARRLRPTEWAVAVAAMILTPAVNAFWLIPTLRFLPYKTFLEDAPFWQNTNLLQPALDFFTPVARMNNLVFGGVFGAVHAAMLLAILLMGIRGLLLWRKSRPELFPAFAATGVFLFVFSYYGSFWRPAAELNPTRYLPTLHLFLLIPAIAAIIHMTERKSVLPVVLLAAFIPLFAYSFFWLRPFHRLLALQTPPQTLALEERLKELPPGGRVLLEDSGALDRNGGGQVYGMAHFPALFPQHTGREFIGGPYPYVFLLHHFATFYDGKLFGREITDFSTGELREYLKTYNVRWVVCWSRPSRLVFDYNKRDFRPVTPAGGFSMYEFVRWRPDDMPQGTASFTAFYNRIEASRVRPEGGAVVLPYHWAPGIRSRPRLKVTGQKLLGDPVPFIRVEDPPARFTLEIKP